MSFFAATLTLLGVAYALALWRLTQGFRRLTRTWHPDKPADVPKVSVIVAARDEERHIADCLRSILQNDYPQRAYEIIAVDDASSDRTAQRIKEVAGKHPNVQLISPSENAAVGQGKRRAIEAGIERARGDIILLTDADSVVPAIWIRTMVAAFDESTHFVAGPVAYSDGRSWFGRFLQLELFGLVGIAAGAIELGRPNMCNGANIGFRKSTFVEIDGYHGTDHLTSGDDELLMQKIAREYRNSVRFCPDRTNVVTTEPPDSVTAWLQQRRRWASKGLKYEDKAVTALALLVYSFNLALATGLVFALIGLQAWGPLVVATLVKLTAEFWLFWSVCTWFGRRDLLTEIVPGQLIEIPYVVIVGAAGALGGYRWKGRLIKR
jgi:cellulose synthase/poly-beta-1,6-N-acetylglucosamine synthase-like glycosyltransferase